MRARAVFADKATLSRSGGEEAKEGEVDVFRFKGWSFSSLHAKMVDSAALDAMQKELLAGIDTQTYKIHFPPLVFGHDIMRIEQFGTERLSSYSLSFNARDALQCWASQHSPTRLAAEPLRVPQVPYSRAWIERSQFAAGASSQETSETKAGDSEGKSGESIRIDDSVTHRAWDWTFSSDYCGSVRQGSSASASASASATASATNTETPVSRLTLLGQAGTGATSSVFDEHLADYADSRFRPSTSSGVDYSALRATVDPILFYDEAVLYCDDLEDCGEVSFSVKLRVMPSCWFVMSRMFLRIDGVMLRLRETRYFHSFGSRQVHLEVTTKECGTSSDEGVALPYPMPLCALDPTIMRDANRLSQEVPISTQHFFSMDL
jgi:hypothetical protein